MSLVSLLWNRKERRKKFYRNKSPFERHVLFPSFKFSMVKSWSPNRFLKLKVAMWINDHILQSYQCDFHLENNTRLCKINPKESGVFHIQNYSLFPTRCLRHENYRRNHSCGKRNFQANKTRSRYSHVIPKKGGSCVPEAPSSLTVIGRLVCNCRHDRIELKAGMYPPKTDGEILDSMYPEEEGRFDGGLSWKYK